MIKAFFFMSAVVAVLAYDPHMPVTYDPHSGAPLNFKGEVVDTPDVVEAKHKHFIAVDDAIHRNLKEGGHYRTPDYYYPETPKLVHGIYLPDTPAVEHAKLDHYAEYDKVLARDLHHY